jgi:hypothetical protein
MTAIIEQGSPAQPSSSRSQGIALSPVNLLLAGIVRRDGTPLIFTIAGCAIAALIAVYQFTVLASFLLAANAAPRYLQADAWVMAKGVPAFDFPYPISADYRASVLRYFPRASARRVVSGFGAWNSPTGNKGTLAVVGVDDIDLPRRSFIYDRSDTASLEDPLQPTRLLREIGRLRFDQARPVTSLATFLGSPYVIMNLADARRVLGASSDQVTFIALNFAPGMTDVDQRLAQAQQDFPELSILGTQEFFSRSAVYWLLKTGGGAAIALSAILAALIMLLFLVAGISRFAQRYHGDFMTLIGLGYDRRLIGALLSRVAILLALTAIGLAAITMPAAVVMTEALVPWVELQLSSFVFAGALTAIAALLAQRVALRQVNQLQLVEVFRT